MKYIIPLADQIKIIERNLLTDQRGWFLKVINGFEDKLPNKTGEIYLTMARPMEWRANHYHIITAEWFTVFKGEAKIIIEDIESKERLELIMTAANPKTLFVPPGIAHVFINTSNTKEMMLIAFAENNYDPADTCPYNLIDR